MSWKRDHAIRPLRAFPTAEIPTALIDVDMSLISYRDEKGQQIVGSPAKGGKVRKHRLPPVVLQKQGERYRLICGHKRYRLGRGLEKQFVIVVPEDTTEEDVRVWHLMDSLKFECLNWMEKAKGLRKTFRVIDYKIISQTIRRPMRFIRVLDYLQSMRNPTAADLLRHGQWDFETVEDMCRLKSGSKINYHARFLRRQQKRCIFVQKGNHSQRAYDEIHAMRRVLDDEGIPEWDTGYYILAWCLYDLDTEELRYQIRRSAEDYRNGIGRS